MSTDGNGAASAPGFDPATFDPFNQSIIIHARDGSEIPLYAQDVMDWAIYGFQTCIMYASQLGASLILLIVVALVTKPDKRKAPIFILNATSLLLNVIRLTMASSYFDSPAYDFYRQMSGDFEGIDPSPGRVSITHTIIGLVEWILVQTSLALQVQVVCVNLEKLYRMIILAISVSVGFIVVGFELTYCIHVVQSIILGVTSFTPWLQKAVIGCTTGSLFWYCSAFVTKLGFALKSRRQLGLRSFGPMKVLFIMGCQTMIIPAIFATIQLSDIGVANFNSLVLTTVVLSLPLSAVWATATVGNKGQVLVHPRKTKRYFSGGSGSNGSFTPFWKRKFCSPASATFTDSTRVGSGSGTSKSQDTNIDLERNVLVDTSVDKTLNMTDKQEVL